MIRLISKLRSKCRRDAKSSVRPVDNNIAEQITAIGFHPFIMIRVGHAKKEGSQYIVCETQNEAPEFLEHLPKAVDLSQNKLVRGLERALRFEFYEAAECWFSWFREAPAGLYQPVFIGLPATMSLAAYYGYPIYEIRKKACNDNGAARLSTLTALFEAYYQSSGNDATRFQLVQALALALSRCLGALGEYQKAASIVDRALPLSSSLWASSIHLQAARHALTLKLDGKVVPDRLMKFIGEDNGYLKEFVCSVPFEHMALTENGDALLCCGLWLPTAIGNFIKTPMGDVLNSQTAQKIRQSMTDGTYKYCNHLDCGNMVRGELQPVAKLDNPRIRKAIVEKNYNVDRLDTLTLSIDQTCNLSCPSCRTHRIIEKPALEKIRAVEEALPKLLPNVQSIFINPTGELFASKLSRRILDLFDVKRCQIYVWI